MSETFEIKRPITRQRSRQSTSTKIRSIMKLNEDIAEEIDSLSATMITLQKSRMCIQYLLRKTIRKENKLRAVTKKFQHAKDELEKAAKDIQTLHKYQKNEADEALKLQTAIALDDTIAAEQQIKRIRKELDYMSPIVEETRKNNHSSIRCYDEVIIPEVPISETWNPQIIPEGSDTCIICVSKESNSVLADCGHVCMCIKCALDFVLENKPNCPVCRAPIQEVMLSRPI